MKHLGSFIRAWDVRTEDDSCGEGEGLFVEKAYFILIV